VGEGLFVVHLDGWELVFTSPNFAYQVVQKFLSDLPSSGALGDQFRENESQLTLAAGINPHGDGLHFSR
jgi:hypothetical protein